MEYYRVTQNRKLRNQIIPEIPGSDKLHSKEAIFIAGRCKDADRVVFPPMIETQPLLLADGVKKIWDAYQIGGDYQPCALGHIEQKRIEVYLRAKLMQIDGLSDLTEYYLDRSLKKIVLSARRVRNKKVFSICYQRKEYYFIDLEILEQMFQNHIYGFQFEKITHD